MARHQLPFVELAAERGGNARVGLEDNIYLSKGVLAKGNFELVRRGGEAREGQGPGAGHAAAGARAAPAGLTGAKTARVPAPRWREIGRSGNAGST